MIHSKSNWEESFFGGFGQILWDYPQIRLDNSVEFSVNYNTLKDVGYYRANTLIKLFLLKCADYNLLDTLVVNAKWEEKKPLWFSTGMTEKKVFKADIEGKKAALNTILMLDTELHNLFKHYYDDILKASITVEVPKEEGTIEDVKEVLGKTSTYKYVSYSLSAGTLKDNVKYFNAARSHKETVYSQEEITHASNLVKVLDIDFDPTYSKVSSLKSGKLDAAKIAECVPGNTNIYYTTFEKVSTKPFKVVILCDESGSMGRTPMYGSKTLLASQHSLVKILYKAFSEILPPKDISVYGHTGSYSPDIYIYNDPYNLDFTHRIDDMVRRQVSQNYDGPVIEALYEKIRSQTQDNILFITISDGEPAGPNYGGKTAIIEMKKIIEKCKRDGFVTMGIGLLDRTVEELYNYNVVVTDFEKDLVKRVSALVNNVVKTEFQN